MANCQETRVKLTDTQLSKLKSATEKKTGTVLRITKKNLKSEELAQELFLITRKTTETRNAIAKNMSTDIKRNKEHLSKTVSQVDFFKIC